MISINSILKNDQHIDQLVSIAGWVRSIRNSKKFSFLVVNDGSSFENLQIVVDASIENYVDVAKLLMGSSVEIEGKVVRAQGGQQSVEMQAQVVKIVSATDDTYPLQKKATSLEFLREQAHFRPRTNTFNAVFRLRHTLAMATHRFFDEREFIYLNSPIISKFDGEGAGAMFQVTTLDLANPPRTGDQKIDYSKDYFGARTNLCVTGQLEGEAFALGLGKIYTFGPTFRAENSNTSRHLSEFWMIEPEMSFYDLEANAQLAEDYLRFLIQTVLEKHPQELEFLEKTYKPDLVKTLQHVAGHSFERLSYTDAVKLLQDSKMNFEFPVEWGKDLQSEHERYLTETILKRPVIVTDYPKEIKAFYMRMNDDEKTVRAMDVLVPEIGEIIGGSQREERGDLLLKRMQDFHLNPDDYWWYQELRKHGGCVHAGFGLGFERAVMYVTGMSNIRDVIPFARTPMNCEF